MRQQQFEAEREQRWQRFERLLGALDGGAVDRAGEFPRLFRHVCQDLALARDRMFTEDLLLRLNRLALRGHEHLYRAPAASLGNDLVKLLWVSFPRALRAERALFLGLCAVFFGSLALAAWSVGVWPDLPRSFLSEDMLAEYGTMYAEDLERGPGRDVGMFGYYIWNNVGIAFRMFAGGLLFGLGSLFALLLNGLVIGLVTGYVLAQGHGQNFLSFVIGHGAFELTAIVIAAVAGTRMGLALIAPGRLSRRGALRRSTETALPLLYGTGTMLAIAAAIEAFWSPSAVGPTLKYAVGGALWVGVGAYLFLAGRRAA